MQRILVMREDQPPLVVPLVVDSPRDVREPQPITFGLPLPRGCYRPGEPLTIDRGGPPIAVQVQPLVTWADGTVKWLLLDFVLDAVTAGRTSATVRRAPDAASGLHVSESAQEVLIDTGAAAFHLGRARLP